MADLLIAILTLQEWFYSNIRDLLLKFYGGVFSYSLKKLSYWKLGKCEVILLCPYDYE